MEENLILFTFFYVLLIICWLYPPKEFESLGLTLENIYSEFLGSEEIKFINYHQRRTTFNYISCATFAQFYIFIYKLRFDNQTASDSAKDFQIENDSTRLFLNNFGQLLWYLFGVFSSIVQFTTYGICLYWYHNYWQKHPISKKLKCFTDTPNSTYHNVATSINEEYRSGANVFKLKINSITRLIATDNWIIKTTPYSLDIAHQSDTELIVKRVTNTVNLFLTMNPSFTWPLCWMFSKFKMKLSYDCSDTYVIAEDNGDFLQMITIKIKSMRRGVKDFDVRMNALDFKELQDRIRRPIFVPPTVQFHKSILDRFIEVFKNQVAMNPKYRLQQESLETCFACLIAEPNVKITKQCLDENIIGQPLREEERCKDCFCRPMWCVECLARWFAARQNDYDRETWLSRKCSCPLCRAQFCMRDLSYIEKE